MSYIISIRFNTCNVKEIVCNYPEICNRYIILTLTSIKIHTWNFCKL